MDRPICPAKLTGYQKKIKRFGSTGICYLPWPSDCRKKLCTLVVKGRLYPSESLSIFNPKSLKQLLQTKPVIQRNTETCKVSTESCTRLDDELGIPLMNMIKSHKIPRFHTRITVYEIPTEFDIINKHSQVHLMKFDVLNENF